MIKEHKDGMVVHVHHATLEEAMEHIAKDTEALSFMSTHGGFFAPELPFRHPIHVKDKHLICWPPVDIAPSAIIGEHIMFGRYTNIVGPVVIGDYCRFQGFNYVPTGVVFEERVFIGPHACFTNVRYPRVRRREDKPTERTIVKKGASIGAGAIVLPGITIGEGSLIGAGAVVTKDVAPNEIYAGVPARFMEMLR